MARPRKTGLDYFPLDVHMDINIQLIEAKFGLMGFGVLIKILQKVYGENGYYCDWDEDTTLLFLKKNNLICYQEELGKMIEMAFDREIFDREMYEKYNVLTSKDIQMKYFEAIIRRIPVIREELVLISTPKINKLIKQTLADEEETDEVKGAETGVNVDNNATKKRKEKKRKEKESKEDEIKDSSVGEIQLSITLKDGSLYHIRDNDINRYSSLYSQLDILQNLKNMVGWFDSNPDKRRTKDEIQNFINSWFRRELKSPPPQLQQPPSTTAKNSSSDINKYFYDDYDEENDPFLRMFDDE